MSPLCDTFTFCNSAYNDLGIVATRSLCLANLANVYKKNNSVLFSIKKSARVSHIAAKEKMPTYLSSLTRAVNIEQSLEIAPCRSLWNQPWLLGCINGCIALISCAINVIALLVGEIIATIHRHDEENS